MKKITISSSLRFKDLIKKIEINNLESVLTVFRSAIEKMKANHIDQWDENYPTIEILRKDILEKSAFGFFVKEEPVAYIVLNNEYDSEYDKIDWMLNHENSIIIHRLTVHSNYQNQGIARALMKFAEEYALNNNYSGIRFDAFSQNSKALHFYKKLGYQEAGSVNFRKGKFIVFEKALS